MIERPSASVMRGEMDEIAWKVSSCRYGIECDKTFGMAGAEKSVAVALYNFAGLNKAATSK
ncbi:hypothetical protein FHS61_000389 [Altererythrobacter atlanticus]|nr:hypothetical protein [Croceibacterium atlanticum]MBB5731396.1 hypothetical protein [Croceibacterium atlanticum]